VSNQSNVSDVCAFVCFHLILTPWWVSKTDLSTIETLSTFGVASFMAVDAGAPDRVTM